MRLSVAIFSIRHNYLSFPPSLRLKSVFRRFSSVRFMQWYNCFKIQSCSNKFISYSVTCLSIVILVVFIYEASKGWVVRRWVRSFYLQILTYILISHCNGRVKHGLVQQIQLILFQAVEKFKVHLVYRPCTSLSTTETLSISPSQNSSLRRNSKKCYKFGPYVSFGKDNIMYIRVIFFSFWTTIKKKSTIGTDIS